MAAIFLRLGKVKEYCEVLIELNEWEKALAVAPAVNYDYWKFLSTKYAAHLASQNKEEAEPFLIVSDNFAKV